MSLLRKTQAKDTDAKNDQDQINTSVPPSTIQTKKDHKYTMNDLAVLTLEKNGRIIECNEAGAVLLGCKPSMVTWSKVSKFMPRLGEVPLLEGERVNPYLRFLSRVGHKFEIVGINGISFKSQLFFNEVENLGQHCLRLIIQPFGENTALTC